MVRLKYQHCCYGRADNLDLIPTSKYPRQMKQAISALQRLLISGYRPSDVGWLPVGLLEPKS